MNKKYKEITIIFENCDCVTILPKDVLNISIRGISKDSWVRKEEYLEWQTCKFVSLALKNSALKNKTVFEKEWGSSPQGFECHLKEYHDITDIEIIFDDGTNEYIAVKWDKNDEQTNSLERVEFEKDWFTIMIGK